MDQRQFQAMLASPAVYRSKLRVSTATENATLGKIVEPFQRQDFEALDAGWQRCMGRPTEGGFSRAWLERCRGGSKTSDAAVMVTYPLVFASKEIRGLCAAVDGEQAGLLRNAIRRLCDLNPWLDEILECSNAKVVNRQTGSELSIVSSDTASSWGHLIDFAVVDEVSCWSEKAEQLWGSILSAIAKKSTAMLVAIGNAGWQGSWQYRTRENVAADKKRWYFHAVTKPASWISPEDLDEQRRLLPALVFSRVWEGEWVPGAGDALSVDDIERAVTEEGPMDGTEPDWRFFSGIDLSISRDHSAVVVLGRHAITKRYRVAFVKRWIPSWNRKINLPEIQATVVALWERFHPRFFADPYQLELMAQQLQAEGVYLELVPFVGTALSEMASGLIEVFQDQTITTYRDDGLVRDLKRLRLKSSPSGWKLDAPRTTADGHCDAATALSLAILGARRLGGNACGVPDAKLLEQADAEIARDRRDHDLVGRFEDGYSRSVFRGMYGRENPPGYEKGGREGWSRWN